MRELAVERKEVGWQKGEKVCVASRLEPWPARITRGAPERVCKTRSISLYESEEVRLTNTIPPVTDNRDFLGVSAALDESSLK